VSGEPAILARVRGPRRRWIGPAALALWALVLVAYVVRPPSAPSPDDTPSPRAPAARSHDTAGPARHAVEVSLLVTETATENGVPTPEPTRALLLEAAWTEVSTIGGALERGNRSGQWRSLYSKRREPDRPLSGTPELDGLRTADALPEACADVGPADRPDLWIHAGPFLRAVPDLAALQAGATWTADGATLLAELNARPGGSVRAPRYAEAGLVGVLESFEDRAGTRCAHVRATGHARRPFGTAGSLELGWTTDLTIDVASRRILRATATGSIHEPRGCEPGTRSNAYRFLASYVSTRAP